MSSAGEGRIWRGVRVHVPGGAGGGEAAAGGAAGRARRAAGQGAVCGADPAVLPLQLRPPGAQTQERCSAAPLLSPRDLGHHIPRLYTSSVDKEGDMCTKCSPPTRHHVSKCETPA